MTGEHHRVVSPTQAFGQRVREVRNQLGWTRAELVQRLETIGSELSSAVLAKIEGAANPDSKAAKRERVTLEEVFALALALGVSPSFLVAPYDDHDYVLIAKQYRPHSGAVLRGWFRGEWTLADEDPEFFFRQMPPEEIRERMLDERERRDAAGVYLRDEIERHRREATGEMGERMAERERRLAEREETDDG